MHQSLVAVLKTGQTLTTTVIQAMESSGLVPIQADNAKVWELTHGQDLMVCTQATRSLALKASMMILTRANLEIAIS